MPVLFNSQSGLAENLPDDAAAKAALEEGSHEVPLISPSGEIGSAGHMEARDLMGKGYTQPTPEHLQQLLETAKYSSTGQQAIGAVEQVAKGVAGPLATAAERAVGVPAKDILGREEAKGTGEKMLEQGIGLVGSAFIPGGQAKFLAGAGELGAHLLGIGEAASTMGKIGTAAAKAAIENAVFQSGDEVSKRLMGDPNQTAGSVLTNVGLATVIGGGTGGLFGLAPTVWESTLGPKADAFLRTISARANGETPTISGDLATVISDLEKAGKEVPAEIKAGLSDNPLAADYFRELRESGTTTGDALRETIEKFKGDVGEQLRSVFQEEAPVTSFEAGEKAKDVISKKAEELNDTISAQYKEVMPHLDAVTIPQKDREAFLKGMIKAGSEFGAKGSPAESLFKTYGERAAMQNSVSQLKELNTEISSEISVARRAGDFKKAEAFQKIKESIKEFQDNQIVKAGKQLEKDGLPGAKGISEALIKDRNAADKSYREFMETIGEISSVGKLGKVRSHGQLQDALEKIPSAKLADKLFDPKNIEGLRYLREKFPEVLETLIQAKKSSLIESATSKGELMHNQLLNAVNKMPKEVRQLMFTPEQMNTINATGKILRESSKRLNPSGTGTAIDKLLSHIPGGVGSMAGMLLGHNPLVGYVLGHVGKFLSRDAPDAAKVSLLKFLGSSEMIDASAFKTMADYFQAAQKGQALLTKSAGAVLKAGQDVLPKNMMPDERSREKLDRKMEEFHKNPQAMLDTGGKLGHYAPDHATAVASSVANVTGYLKTLKPTEIKNSPLDEPYTDPAQKERYHDALDIAQQPLSVFQNVQEGTLTSSQVNDLKAMYPDVYSQMSNQLMQAMADHVEKGEMIPYSTQASMSLFLGQPLESSLSGKSILSAQMAQNRTNAREAAKQGGMPASKSSKALTKMADGYETPSQSREQQRQLAKV